MTAERWRRGADVRRRHRRRHGRSRAAGAGRRRGARATRPRPGDDPLRRRRARASRRDCCRRRRSRTRSSTSSGCSAALDRRNARASCPSCAPAHARGGRARSAPAAPARGRRRSAATPACPPCSPPGALDIPIVVVSYDRRPGRASALAARRRRRRRAVAFAGSTLPRAEVTGAPVRQAILDVDRAADRARPARRLGLPADRFVVAVIGGSLGSGVLNDGGRRATSPITRDDVGAGRAPRRRRALRRRRRAGDRRATGGVLLPGRSATSRAWQLVYAAADLLIGRGGASTVAEVAVDRHAGDPRAVVGRGRGPPDRATSRWLADQGGGRAPAPRATAGRALAQPTIERLRARSPAARRQLGDRAAVRRRACTAVGALGRARSSGSPVAGCLVDAVGRTSTASTRTVDAALADRPRPSIAARPLAPAAPARGRRRWSRDERRSPSSWPRWATPCPAATSASSRCSIGCVPPASTCTSVTTARIVARRATPSPRRRRSRRHNIELDEARERGIPALRRAGMLASICAQARLARRRRHARQDHDDVDADADPGRGRPGAELRRSAATSPTSAPARSGPAASGSSSRPTRATAPTSSCRCTARS